MAEVWLAEQITLGRKVALKLLRKELMADAGYVARFKREATAAAGLNHPNIVQVYLVGEQEGQHYIAQEYVQGATLRQLLKKKGPPEVPLALHIMRQVAAALQAAAEAGIVHRDIKPENIMINRKGEIKVADFGLARLQEAGAQGNHITQEGITMGTPLYMSPEQVQGEPLDPRSDIYSFGVTAYHMLAGRPPFEGPTAMSVAVKHLQGEAPPLAELRPDLPANLSQLVMKMMAREPAQRYQSAQAVLADLKKVSKSLRETDAQAAVALDNLEEATRPDGEGRPATATRGLASVVALIVGVGVASAGVGWWLRPRNPLDSPPAPSRDIARQASAREQYIHAMFLGDNEDAWRSVIDDWDEQADRVWIRQAQEQLTLLLLRHPDRWEAAEQMLDTLQTYERENRRYQAEALAGRAYLLARRGEHQRSRNLIQSQLDSRLGELPDAWLRLIVDAQSLNQQQEDRLRGGTARE